MSYRKSQKSKLEITPVDTKHKKQIIAKIRLKKA